MSVKRAGNRWGAPGRLSLSGWPLWLVPATALITAVVLVAAGGTCIAAARHSNSTNEKPGYVVSLDPPRVTTKKATNVTADSAVLNGEIIALGGGEVRFRGFLYHELGASAWLVRIEPGSFGLGAYSYGVVGLKSGTTYEFRAVAGYDLSKDYNAGALLQFTTRGSSDDGHDMKGSPEWYLAEGSTDYGFDAYVSIQNPNAAAVTAQVTYMTGNGPVAAPDVGLPARSQATINPREVLGNQDFSTRVVCREVKAIAADRTMSWTGPGAASPEAHNSIGVTAPAKTWYLPEGSSDWGFECWLLIQNPSATDARCSVTYMIEGEGPQTFEKVVPASSRRTFNMAEDIGEKDASIKVEGNVPVIPERAMYRNNRREGHDSIGTTSPSEDFYLAEGTSAWGFTTYVLIQNPNTKAADVTVTYMTGEGPRRQAQFRMDANSRKTIRVNDVLPNTDFSTEVHGSAPIIAERAMYWDNGTGEACHDSVGMAAAHMSFFLPDGQTSEGRETFTLVQNPNSVPVTVEISYLTPSGEGNALFYEEIPANSRRTFNMADAGISGRAAVMVVSKTSGKRIMVERAMYWNSRGAGTDTIGGFSD